MKKYLLIFSLSLQNEFTYRINFILWRFRNFLKILMTYFLWKGIFFSVDNAFGYTENQMVTYVLMVLVVSALVYSSPSSEIGGEIARGELSNYLVKPVNYLRFWFTRDIASKLLNLIFVCFELSLMWFLFKPQFEISLSFINLLAFIIAVILAVFIYFFFSATTRFFAFWIPENIWGIAFLSYIFMDLLGGTIFPLDILPANLRLLLELTPFPYFIYYPIAIFVGKITGFELVRILVQSAIWAVMMGLIARYIWKKGLINYAAEGK